MRARNTSASASRFMNSLTTQLHVPAENARAIGEELVAGKFACPLGGKYVLVDPASPNAPADDAANEAKGEQLPASNQPAPSSGRKLWASTAPPAENRFLLTVIPAD